jgi:uncharacterized protein DUF4124
MTALPARLALLVALCAAGAHAREVYKCTNAQGDVAFQDKPCAGGNSESTVRLAEPPPYVAPATPVAAAPAEEKPAVPPPTPPPRSARPLPEVWFCTNAEDGSHYTSVGGLPPPRSVPLGTLGYPGKSLADAYKAGANVMSAPELSKPPIDASPGSRWATQYTDLQDYCVAADVAQTCAYLRQQYDQTSDKLRRARFKDEQARLQGQLDSLDLDLGGC